MNRIALFIFLPIILFGLPYSAMASEVRAFHNINQLPFKQIFGLPSLENNPLTEAGRFRINVISNISNTFDISNGSDNIITDTETVRASLVLSYAVRNNWQLGVELPYVRHNGGFLDDFIYDWHDFFNLPQNGRAKDSSDRIQVAFLSSTGASFALNSSGGGLGDIRINSNYTLPWHNRALIISTELKLPTGEFAKLTGSGGLDFSMGLMLNDPLSLGKYRLTLFGGLAGVFLGDIDSDMSAIQNKFALTGRIGVGWQASRFIQLKLQLDGHTALYDSDVKEMGDSGLQLVFGSSIILSDSTCLDMSIAEDISISTAADVAFQLALAVSY
ncbi:MAG: DUF3187 family protein [Deltaproteobacteria bacterium]|jgi:hypothetical protein|nr:DUF3187 family protein [Deltaproteobacteria bacterium]